MPKPDPALTERVQALLEGQPARRRPMFGTHAWFLDANDQMLAGVWGDAVNLRVGAPEVERLVASGEAAPFEVMAGRRMKEYVLVSAAGLDDEALRGWLEQAIAFTSTLAAKKKR